MGQITPAALQAAFQGFNTLFKGALQSAPTFLDPIMSEKTSDGESENYGWLAKIPLFRPWIGERVWNNLDAYVQTLYNVVYENGVEIDKYKFINDKLGLYSDSFKMLGIAAKQIWDVHGVYALTAGKVVNVMDAQPFFSASHPVNPFNPASATQSNYYASGMPLNAANYRTVRQNMMALKGEDGSPLNIIPDTLIVGPALEGTAKDILEAEQLNVAFANAVAGTNVNRGTAKVLLNPRLSGTITVPDGYPGAGTSVNFDNAWILTCNSFPVKALVKQIHTAPTLTALDMPFLPNVVDLKKFRYAGEAYGAVGYGLWQMAAFASA
jgi:phage major head subunit gpT-like protein